MSVKVRPNPYEQFSDLKRVVGDCQHELVNRSDYLARVPRTKEWLDETDQIKWNAIANNYLHGAESVNVQNDLFRAAILTLDTQEDIIELNPLPNLSGSKREAYVALRSAGVVVGESFEIAFAHSSRSFECSGSSAEALGAVGIGSAFGLRVFRASFRMNVVRYVQWLNADSDPRSVVENIRAGVIDEVDKSEASLRSRISSS